MKLGRLPRKHNLNIPSYGQMKAMLHSTKTPIPPLQTVLDHASTLPGFIGMMLNDTLGDCTCAGMGHETQLVTWGARGAAITADDNAIVAAYEAIGGYVPNDPATDNGCDEQSVLAWWKSVGLMLPDGSRHQINGYVEVDKSRLDYVCEAIQEFGCVYIGFEVPEQLMMEGPPIIWDALPTYTNIEGGHCLVGETSIPLLSGKSITIAEMAANPDAEYWVYSTNERGKMRPGKVSHPRLTRRDVEVIRVTLDNGESVTCTSDHPFMLRDGSYLPAGQLTVGASLMPNYRRISEKEDGLIGYEMFLDNASGNWNWTHRRVAGSMRGLRPGLVVHHGDFDKWNNDPANLFPMTWEAHTELHALVPIALHDYARSDRGRQKSRELMAALWADPEWRANSLKRVGDNGRKRFLELAEQGLCGFQTWTDEQWKANGKKTGNRLRGKPRDPDAVKQGAETRRLRMENDPIYAENLRKVARENIAKQNKAVAMGETPSGGTLSRNHTVVRVEPAGRSDVYDLTVDKYHNFAVDAGIFVHNCVLLTGFDRTNQNAIKFNVVSWGTRQWIMTQAFVEKFVDEIYAIVDPLWIEKTGQTPLGLTEAQLESIASAI